MHLPDDAPVIELTLQWFDKAACRLPEALWLTFNPRVPSPSRWTMDKLGQAVSPLDVVLDGNRLTGWRTRPLPPSRCDSCGQGS